MTIHRATVLHPATTDLPGYTVGRWLIDPVHSTVSFTARHLVTKVRGSFRDIEGEVNTTADPLGSSVAITIRAESVDTANHQRDQHLRSADFLDVEQYPLLHFTSTALRPLRDRFLIDGDLTIKGVTRQITANLEPGGFAPAHDGTLRAGYTASFDINRKDFNVNFHWVLETGGVMVGDQVDIQLDIEAILQDHP